MALVILFKKLTYLNQGTLGAVQSQKVAWADLPTFYRQHSSFGSVRQRFCHSSEEISTAKPSSLSRKRLRVAIVGRPNAGKSTLINRILNLNVCDVSPKTHTTRTLLQTAFTRGNTQIVFVDTPGLVTKKEFLRFGLSDTFVDWRKDFHDQIDIIGLIHEVTSSKDIFKLHLKEVQWLNEIPETKPMFIMLNKIDSVVDKAGLSEALNRVTKPKDVQKVPSPLPSVWNKFSSIFFISAIKNIGVAEVVDFLLEQAQPGDWVFQPSIVFNKPLHLLVTDLLRAKIMGILPYEIPYKFRFEVEYMEENNLGEIICVALVMCKQEKHLRMIVQKKKKSLKGIAKALESDLYKILGKVFRLRVVVCDPSKPRCK